ISPWSALWRERESRQAQARRSGSQIVSAEVLTRDQNRRVMACPRKRGHDPSWQILLMSWFSHTDLGAPRLATFSIARPTHSVVVTYFGKSNLHTGESGPIIA